MLLAGVLILVDQVAGAQELYVLKNSNIECAVDSKGNLITLKNVETGHNYASGNPIWRLYFDNHEEKEIEIVSKDNIPVIHKRGNQISIDYNHLKKGDSELNFSLSLKIFLEADQIRFSSRVSNHEAHTIIRELEYPLVSNCQLPADHELLTTEDGGCLYPSPLEAILSVPHSYWGPDQLFRQKSVKYPVDVAANCFALTGKDQGLYFGSHDTSFQDTWHGLRVYPDAHHNFNKLEAGLYKYPNCLFGHSWNNDCNVIVPYSGDWHQTANIYRKWVNTWWEHQKEPLWVRKMKGFQRIIMKSQYGRTYFKYDELATRIKDAGDSAGIHAVFPFGWWNSGMDNGYPNGYYETDSSQGGDQAWKRAIADYQAKGGKVIMYFNGKLIDSRSKFYQEGDGSKVSLKSNAGIEVPEFYRFPGTGTFTGYYNNRTFVVADTKNPLWRKELFKMADRGIELGANSVFYDQLGYAEKTGNWDTTKEFPIPELHVIRDKAQILKMLRAYITSKNKDLAIGTEHITDVTSQYVDYTHSIFNLMGRYNFVEWFRYAFPEIILTDRNLDGDEPNYKAWVNRTLLLGLRTNIQTFRLRGLINETPHLQDYLAQINQLKDQYASLLLLGIYHDNEDFTLDNSHVQAKSFVSAHQLAVVVTQRRADKQQAQIKVKGYRFKEFSKVGDVQVNKGTQGNEHLVIGKDGLAVLVYDKIQ